MPVETFSTLAQTTLNGAITNVAVSAAVIANATFPGGGQFHICIEPGSANQEICLVTDGGGTNTWTIARGQEGTAAVAHGDGSLVIGILTAAALQRALARPDLQPGALASGDAALTVNSTTQVTVAAAEQFYVTTSGGLLLPVTMKSTALSGITAPVTNPRLDQIVVDSNGVVTRVAGAETVGATLANRSGAGAIPSGSRLLHDLLVTVAGGVTAANARDRRPWARGGYNRIVRSANAGAGNDYTTTSTSLTLVDATNLAMRLECSGVPVRASLRGRISMNTTGNTVLLAFALDGAIVDAPTTDGQYGGLSPVTTADIPFNFMWDFAPSSGSHLLQPYWRVTAGTATLYARAAIALELVAEEIVRQNANNGTA